jgi:predicted dehydrogenase
MDALTRRRDVEIVAAVDLNPRTARTAPPNGVPIRRSMDELPHADIAIVSTPTPTHAAVCSGLFDRVPGLSLVLCEKPGALTASQLADLFESARARGIEFRVLLHYAFGSEVLWLANRLARLGDIAAFSASFEDPYRGALAERTKTLVSSWADSGINALTVLARLLEPKAIIDSHSTGEATRTTLSFTSGHASGTGLVTTNWGVSEPRKRTSLSLVDGTTVDIDHLAGTVTAKGSILFRVPSGDVASMRYRTMIDAHLDDAPSLLDEATTMHLHRLLADGLSAQRQHPNK